MSCFFDQLRHTNKDTGSNIGEVRKKITKTYERISGAHHESSHTVYCLLHLIRVNEVSIFENKKLKRIHGLTSYLFPENLASIEDDVLRTHLIETEIKLSYAGLIGEGLFFKSISGSDSIPLFIKEGSSDDNKMASNAIKKYDLAPPGKKRYAFKQKMLRRANRELIDNWGAITTVAHGLFRHHKLNYDDLRSLLIDTERKSFWKGQFKKIDQIHNKDGFDEQELKAVLLLT